MPSLLVHITAILMRPCLSRVSVTTPHPHLFIRGYETWVLTFWHDALQSSSAHTNMNQTGCMPFSISLLKHKGWWVSMDIFIPIVRMDIVKFGASCAKAAEVVRQTLCIRFAFVLIVFLSAATFSCVCCFHVWLVLLPLVQQNAADKCWNVFFFSPVYQKNQRIIGCNPLI